MHIQDLTHNRQAQSGAATLAGAARVNPIKALCQARQVTCRNAGTIVADL